MVRLVAQQRTAVVPAVCQTRQPEQQLPVPVCSRTIVKLIMSVVGHQADASEPAVWHHEQVPRSTGIFTFFPDFPPLFPAFSHFFLHISVFSCTLPLSMYTSVESVFPVIFSDFFILAGT